jgi:hypothetical protein
MKKEEPKKKESKLKKAFRFIVGLLDDPKARSSDHYRNDTNTIYHNNKIL